MVRKRRPGKGRQRNPERDRARGQSAWRMAETTYGALRTLEGLVHLGSPLTPGQRIDRLRAIVDGCPHYYPALIDLGSRLIGEGEDDEGREYIARGLRSLERRGSRKDLLDAHYAVGELLEDRLRFEMAIELYTRLKVLEREPAGVLDRIACCHVHLGDLDEAVEMQRRAVALDDDNARLLCNLGWIELLRGELGKARTYLDRSLAMDPGDEVAVGNRQVLDEMLAAGTRDLEAHLLRPVDRDRFRRLGERGRGEDAALAQRYGRERLEAFKLHLGRDPDLSPRERYDILFTLRYVMGTIEGMCESCHFLCDDLPLMVDDLRDIMHRLIIVTGDMDEELLDGMIGALGAFYGFLEGHGLVDGSGGLKEEMTRLRSELLDKLRRYNAVRHRDGCTDEERLEARSELFDVGDFLPML